MITLRTPLFEGESQGGGGGAAPAPAWHEGIISKGVDGAESLADPASWLDKAPAPLAGFIRDNMTAARQKTEGMIKMPGADAKPEDFDAFYKALGRPDAPEAYDMAAPEKMPDGINWDENMGKEFSKVAHAIGLTPSQAVKVKEFQVGYVGSQAAANQVMMDQALKMEKEDLAKRFGGEVDKAVVSAGSLVNARGVPESLKKAAASGAFDPNSTGYWGNDALEFASWAARASGEDHRGGGASGGGGASSELSWAKAVMSDPKHTDRAALDRQDPATVERFNRAYATAYPQK